MALRKILTQEDEILRKSARPVEVFDGRLHILLDDMVETLLYAEGVGLAAPQVGVLRRVLVVDTGDKHPLELVNPVIIRAKGSQQGSEGCLSVPGMYGLVKRPMAVTVRAQDRKGRFFEKKGEALLARAFCHEVDHLDGKLFTTLVTRWLDPEKDKEYF